MSRRGKFTFPERQLEACREPVGFTQCEIGAASEASRRPGSRWSRSPPARGRVRMRRLDRVLSCGARPYSVDVACGRGARPGCANVVLDRRAWTWCSGSVLGRASWTWCWAVVRGRGAHPGCVNLVLGHGA